jgi:hypothetical protein
MWPPAREANAPPSDDQLARRGARQGYAERPRHPIRDGRPRGSGPSGSPTRSPRFVPLSCRPTSQGPSWSYPAWPHTDPQRPESSPGPLRAVTAAPGLAALGNRPRSTGELLACIQSGRGLRNRFIRCVSITERPARTSSRFAGRYPGPVISCKCRDPSPKTPRD